MPSKYGGHCCSCMIYIVVCDTPLSGRSPDCPSPRSSSSTGSPLASSPPRAHPYPRLPFWQTLTQADTASYHTCSPGRCLKCLDCALPAVWCGVAGQRLRPVSSQSCFGSAGAPPLATLVAPHRGRLVSPSHSSPLNYFEILALRVAQKFTCTTARWLTRSNVVTRSSTG